MISLVRVQNCRHAAGLTRHLSALAQQDIKMPKIDPLAFPDYFNVKSLISIKEMMEARVHFGHTEGSLNDRMKPYIFGTRLGHIIFDLDQTSSHLHRALNVTAHVALQGGIILFFCRSAINAHLVEKTALECGEYAHTKYWRGGTFTNSKVQFKAVTRLPDLTIFLNTQNNILTQHTAVRDAAKMNIPSIGILDSNCTPDLITYPVPGNDDSPAAIAFYCKVFKHAILEGKRRRKIFLDKIEEHEKKMLETK